jgi:hypothetical protein
MSISYSIALTEFSTGSIVKMMWLMEWWILETAELFAEVLMRLADVLTSSQPLFYRCD